MNRTLFVVACAALIGVGSNAQVTDDILLKGHRGDPSGWPMYGGDYHQQRYSELDQINRDNVASLELAWKFHTEVFNIASGYQTTPVVHDGAMYVTTPRVSRSQWVIKLDARKGKEIWRTELRQGASVFCCGANNRGVALYEDKVFVATIDATLYALDAKSGNPVWSVPTGEGGAGYSQTCAPLIYDDKIVIGVAGGEYGIRGYVSAYDVNDGSLLWRWYTIPSPEEGGWHGDWVEELPGIGLSLNRDIEAEKALVDKHPDSWKNGGVPVWTTPSLDPEARLVYVVTGNPGPDYDDSMRPGDNLWGDAICALNLDTGELAWGFQYVPHDLWDYDGGCPPVLFDTEIDGVQVPAVGLFTKIGYFYLLNRLTGELLQVSEPYVPQQNFLQPLTEEGIVIAPGSAGGTNWSPAAYSPQTGWVYSANNHWPMLMTTRPGEEYREGASYQGGNASFSSLAEERWGNITAIDPISGKLQWEQRVEQPFFSGVLATKGGLVFAGQSQGSFDAWDARTGDHLWGVETDAGVNAAPSTFMLKDKQYVAVSAGGSRYVRRSRENPPEADQILVFALP